MNGLHTASLFRKGVIVFGRHCCVSERVLNIDSDVFRLTECVSFMCEGAGLALSVSPTVTDGKGTYPDTLSA